MNLHIVLHEPEIPQNTGSIGRTCMAIGAHLHLIRPLGFSLKDPYLKRAGLDYWNNLELSVHEGWGRFRDAWPEERLWFFTTKAQKSYDEVVFGDSAFLVFGKESRGIPNHLLREKTQQCLRIPMAARARSLNLSVSVGIAAYEALRQRRFDGLSATDPEKRL